MFISQYNRRPSHSDGKSSSSKKVEVESEAAVGEVHRNSKIEDLRLLLGHYFTKRSLGQQPFPEHVRNAPIGGVSPLFCCCGGLPLPRPPIGPPPLPAAWLAIGMRWSSTMLGNEYCGKYRFSRYRWLIRTVLLIRKAFTLEKLIYRFVLIKGWVPSNHEYRRTQILV